MFRASCGTSLLTIGLLLLSCAPPEPPSEALNGVLQQISQNQEWLQDTRVCPADVMLDDEAPIGEDDCESPRLRVCLSSCTSGDGGACYWLAYALQKAKAPEPSIEALFQRACRLGVTSGCTNRAAGVLSGEVENDRNQTCAARTFQKTCAHDDPWGCTMYALHLSRGMGVPQDRKLALQVLEKSCKYGPEDEACTRGMRLKEQLLKAR
jgi:TPR repeat protein